MRTLSTFQPTELPAQSPETGLVSSSFRLSLANGPFSYVARLANAPKDLEAAQALRFEVFNLELGQGLEQSFERRLDADEFDPVCAHLVVEDQRSGQIVGTYRLQTGHNAGLRRGYYCEQEFYFAPFEPLRGQLVELGRACVAPMHRNLVVLQLLWRGIAFYARTHGARYLIGCSSIDSQDPTVGAALYSRLIRQHMAPAAWQTRPQPGFGFSLHQLAEETPEVPKLMGAYLALGAKICGPPAMDCHFKTIDFLTFLDLEDLPKRSAEKFLR